MPIIKKYAETLPAPLSSFGTLVIDNDPNSKYFRITELKETLTAGKNGFLIEGSPFLQETTEIKIQILDVEGNPIYWEPGNGIPEYYEGTSKVVAMYIYNDTPIGDATITVLGELKQYVNEFNITTDVPDDWKGVYNVKWQKTLKVNKLLSNEDRVRFYRRPRVTIEELIKPLFSTTIPTVVQSGSIDGSAITPSLGNKLSDYTLPTLYRLQIADNTNWTGSILNQRISIPELNYNPLITQIVTNKEVITNEPYTVNGTVESFDNASYTASFQHIEGTSNLKTALTGSFAKITISDLTTFVGDVVSVDVYRKSRSKIGDYEFVQKVILESNELLKDYDTTNTNEENYGILSIGTIKDYWVSSSNSTVTFNQNYLYNSAQIDVSSGYGYFYTSQSFNVNKDSEYTLEFSTRTGFINPTGSLRAFISGSTTSTLNGITSVVGIEQDIIKINGSDSQYLQQTTISENFEALNITGSKLYFEVKGDDWYISDISLKASQETSFSPNEITVVQSVPRTLVSERFDYRFKFYDINGNYIPVNVEASKLFDGGNLQRIEKKLNLNPTSLYFQFDSGSQPVAPTVIAFNIEKTLLTGSVNFTSSSIDFFGNVLSASQYVGGVFPGTLDLTNPDIPVLTVARFTGSRDDIDVQLVTFTGECEGVTDTVTITAVLDGFGGVNHIIRPYRGTQIRNSSTASLEIQAVRIDGINDIELYSGSRPDRGWNLIQFHVLSGSNPNEKFINLQYASASGFIQGLSAGLLGSKEINYNAVFNRDSIDKRRTIYLMSSASAASGPALITSASVLASQILEDLQDGLDTPVVVYNADTFTINFRNDTEFRPTSASATASFYIRGTNENPISASILVYPSMSINRDFVPEYWMYWVSQSKDSTISISAKDEKGFNVPPRLPITFIGNPLSQSKVLTTTFTYTEPYTLTEISIDKTFTIVPEGKPGDESIVFELVPSNLTLNANAKGIVSTYTPANTQLKLKQGAQYLAFSSSKDPGTFWLNYVTESMISSGAVNYSETSSMNITGISNLMELSASLIYDLLIHPYFTSSRYTQSIVQNFTKAVDGPPQIEILINPANPTIAAFETGFPKSYLPASTSIQLKEGNDILIYTSSQQRGTWFFQSISGSNIQTASISPVNSGQNRTIGGVSFTNFLPQYTSASALYNLRVYPYSLLPGHKSGSVLLFATQSFTKNVDPKSARTVKLSASSNVINFDGDDVVVSPLGPITLTAEAINVTSSNPFYQFLKYDPDSATYADVGQGITQINYYDVDSGDAVGSGETSVYRVELRDGTAGDEVRGVDEVTIFGVKAGSDAFTANLTNENTSIQVSLWETTFSGSGTEIRAFKSGVPLVHTSSYVSSQVVYYEYGANAGLPIGNLGYYSASIHSKSSYITVNPQNRLLGNPASIGNLINWTSPAVNTTGTIVYKVDFEGGRKTEFYSQSISSQITAPAPYIVENTNNNASIQAELWTTNLAGSGNIIRAFRGSDELVNTNPLPATDTDNYGVTGLSKNKARVTIHSKSSHITLAGSLTAGSFVSGTPATIGNLSAWTAPAVNNSATIVYKVECEGRQTIYQSQSLSVQITPPAPYNVLLSNENSGIIYRVSGEVELDLTSTTIRAYRGDLELTNVSTFSGAQTDMYGNTGYPNQCRVSILAYSGHIILGGGLTAGSHVSGTPATTPIIADWLNPETYPVGEIIYQIDCEGRETLIKTQSLSVTYEGNTGPGIVMRGVWSSTIDYLADQVNKRRDAVIWPDPETVNKETHYWAAITGSGPSSTWGAQQPDGSSPYNDTAYWQYLGQEEFFVAAQIAIFQESYVKNTINVGTKDGTGAFANIVIAGGRTDPYIAIGQTGTQGTAGKSGTSLSTPGVIGYNRPGIFLGLYEDGANGTTGRFSIKTTGTSGKGMFWDGDQLTIVGSIRQRQPGIPEGSFRGAWVAGVTYYPDDTVTYGGASYINSITHTSTNNTNINTGYPPNATNTWTVYAAAGTSGLTGTSGTSGASGTNGSPGAGVVFRGNFATGSVYYHTSERKDIVRAGSTFYLVNNTSLNNNSGSVWGTPTGANTNWSSFGAQFSSVATDVLLAQDATITRGLVMGTEGSDSGFIRSANAATLLNGQGFYLDVQGRMRFGQQVSGSNKYVYFDGTDLNINATVNAPDGNIGGFTIANNKLLASGGLLVLDTQIPQMEVYKRGDTASPKVVINSSDNLTDPSSGTTYVSESTWTGTTTAASSGTTTGVDTYVVQYNGGGLGVTTDGSGDPQNLVTLAGGATQFSVYIPETSLAITAGTISTTTDYPPDPPTQIYETYASRYSYPRSATGTWFLQLWNSAGTTKLAEAEVVGATHYSAGAYSYTYYYAGGSYPLSWAGPQSFNQSATYTGNIVAGTKGGTIIVPATGTYKVRLAYRLQVGSGAVQDVVANTQTYYGNTATPSHAETGFINYLYFSFTPNKNKTEITNGGIQVINNQNAYFKVNRIEPSSYGVGSYILQSKGGIHDFTGGGTNINQQWNNSCLAVYGKMYGVGVLELGGGTSTITDTEILKVQGGTTKEAVFDVQVKPWQNNTYSLGNTSFKWKDVWAVNGTIQTSDITQKTEIQNSILGLDFINRLNPVSYRYISGSAIFEENEIKTINKKIKEEVIAKDGTIIEPAEYKEIPNPDMTKLVGWNPGVRKHYGLVAQQVKDVLDDLNIPTSDFGGYIEGDLENHKDLALRYEEFLAPMIKAIQELSQKVSTLEAIISGSI